MRFTPAVKISPRLESFWSGNRRFRLFIDIAIVLSFGVSLIILLMALEMNPSPHRSINFFLSGMVFGYGLCFLFGRRLTKSGHRLMETQIRIQELMEDYVQKLEKRLKPKKVQKGGKNK